MIKAISTEKAANKLSELCDIHQHIVFGVDDGAKDPEVSVAMLEECVRQNVTSVVCTSHIDGNSTVESRLRYRHNFAELNRYTKEKELPITLYQGSEVLYSEDTVDQLMNGIALPLGKSDCVMVEFHPLSSYDIIKSAVSMLYNEGYRPVIAHIERYNCLRDTERLSFLRNRYKVLTQMNAGTVVSAGKIFGSRFEKKAIRSGLVDMIGSDAHNLTTRRQNMNAAEKVLVRMVGAENARRMCCDTARAIIRKGTT